MAHSTHESSKTNEKPDLARRIRAVRERDDRNSWQDSGWSKSEADACAADCRQLVYENEALFGAAPDLLAACVRARQLLEDMSGHWPGTMSIDAKQTHELVDAAISKAQGT